MERKPIFSPFAVAIIVLGATMLGSTLAIVSFNSQPRTTTNAGLVLSDAFPNLTFSQPVGIYHAGDESNRLFVLERAGIIEVFNNSEKVNTKTVFLDIRDRVNSAGFEEGLLGLAFHPDYLTNGYFYVDYTAANPRRSVIARYQTNPLNPNQANKSSEFILMMVLQPFENHNGGQIVFGPDGLFYIGVGDGGGAGDPYRNAQNLSTLLGKILRIDIDHNDLGLNYSIPLDNPFLGNTQGFREEIYAYGLRNPWRFSFDPATGKLWVADVGQDLWEEIDIVDEGKNYGWNIMEGNHSYPPSSISNLSGLELPIWEYGHDLGDSVTGGFVYRGARIPQLVGFYVYGDFESGRIWSLEYYGLSSPINTQLFDSTLMIASFGVDENNELYVCDFNGRIYTLLLSTS